MKAPNKLLYFSNLVNFFVSVTCKLSLPRDAPYPILIPSSTDKPSVWPFIPGFPSFPSLAAGHRPPNMGSTRLDTSAELVLGTFAQDLDNTWFYETSYPVILKLPIADYSPDAHKLEKFTPHCENDDITKDYLCPSEYHMDAVTQRMSQASRFYKNIQVASVFGSEADDTFYHDDLRCSKIKPHFFHFSAYLPALNAYILELRKQCLLAKKLEPIEKVLGPVEPMQTHVRKAYEHFSKLLNDSRPRPDQFTKTMTHTVPTTTGATTTSTVHTTTAAPTTSTTITTTVPTTSTVTATITSETTPKLGTTSHKPETTTHHISTPVTSHPTSTTAGTSGTTSSPPTTTTARPPEAVTSKLFDMEEYGKAEAAWKFTQLAGYSAFQNTYAMTTYADSIKWTNAFTSCQAYHLDINLIPPETLRELLDEVSRNLSSTGYNISMPVNKLLTNFYKLPLTDCVLGMDGPDVFLILRLMVPVIRTKRHYKLIKLNKVPFFIRQAKRNRFSMIAGSLCQIKNFKYEETFLVEYDTDMQNSILPTIKSVSKAPVTCTPYHICKLPEPTHKQLVDPCVEGIIYGDEDATKDFCNFTCYQVTRAQVNRDFPYVIKLTSNRFAVIGAMPDEAKWKKRVSITCFGKRITWLKQDKTDEATIIRLPCHCNLVLGETKYVPEKPCVDSLEILHVAHVIGNGFDGFKGFDGDEKPKSIQDIMNGAAGNKTLPGNFNQTSSNKTGKDLPGDLDENGKPLPTDKIKEETIDDDIMFVIPSSDNREVPGSKEGSSGEDILVIDASEASKGDWCVHVVIWLLGWFIMITNIAMIFVLWKKGFVNVESFLFI